MQSGVAAHYATGRASIHHLDLFAASTTPHCWPTEVPHGLLGGGAAARADDEPDAAHDGHLRRCGERGGAPFPARAQAAGACACAACAARLPVALSQRAHGMPIPPTMRRGRRPDGAHGRAALRGGHVGSLCAGRARSSGAHRPGPGRRQVSDAAGVSTPRAGVVHGGEAPAPACTCEQSSSASNRLQLQRCMCPVVAGKSHILSGSSGVKLFTRLTHRLRPAQHCKLQCTRLPATSALTLPPSQLAGAL